eukprot:TRINITY_DN20792_c0_g1_i1.p1 TRINITY_DN20792_c0_g1~~TRINITY_DN20792_c0_g1_i1.p1  ORF type:complete len:671 (+),score=70.86 TRINITY_DN20792_c0_g1_i1:30-2042(+)
MPPGDLVSTLVWPLLLHAVLGAAVLAVLLAGGGTDDALGWGLLTRGVGGAHALALLSALPQLVPWLGPRGLFPLEGWLRRVRQSLPWHRRCIYFPTFLWTVRDEHAVGALQAGCLVGACAGAMYALGWGGVPALGLAWACLLSLVTALQQSGDVQSQLFEGLCLEAGFLCLFAPPPVSGGLAAAGAPPPPLRWAFQWLLLRVYVGFGRKKFLGAPELHPDPLRFMRTAEARGQLKVFFARLPFLSGPAWLLHRLPHAVLVGANCGLFVTELVAPLSLLLPCTAHRPYAAALMAYFQVGIATSGNFGVLNLVAACLCLPPLFGAAPPPLLPIDADHPCGSVCGLALLAGGVLHSQFDSYTNGWVYSHRAGTLRPRWLAGAVPLLRAVQPFHILHAYGVFDLDAGAECTRKLLLVEGSCDGTAWREYRWRYLPTEEARMRPLHSPQCRPLLDNAAYYQRWCDNAAHVAGQDPFSYGAAPLVPRLAQRLLERHTPVAALFADVPFPPAAPPRFIRVRTCRLRYSTWEEWWGSGRWFVRLSTKLTYGPVSDRRPHVFWWPPDWALPSCAPVWRRRLGLPAAGPYPRAAGENAAFGYPYSKACCCGDGAKDEDLASPGGADYERIERALRTHASSDRPRLRPRVSCGCTWCKAAAQADTSPAGCGPVGWRFAAST